jgi:hypothetical protein
MLGIRRSERMAAGEQFVVDHSVGENVAQPVDFRIRELLRRHVENRAQQVALLGQARRLPVTRDTGDSEIQDFHGAVRKEPDVRRLHIPMEDAVRVGAMQPLGRLPHDADFLQQREGLLARDHLRQVLPFEQFHGDKRPPFVLAELVDGDDVPVPEIAGRAGFHAEPADQLLALAGEHLDRDRPVHGGVVGAIHAAERPLSDDGLDLVLADAIGHGNHVTRPGGTDEYPPVCRIERTARASRLRCVFSPRASG